MLEAKLENGYDMDAIRRLAEVEEQLKTEGITVEISQLLSEAVFAGNALINWDGVTPYHARMGVTPQMLPDVALRASRRASSG